VKFISMQFSSQYYASNASMWGSESFFETRLTQKICPTWSADLTPPVLPLRPTEA